MSHSPSPVRASAQGVPDLSGSRITALSLTGDGAVVSGRNAPGALPLADFAEALVATRLSDISRRTFGDVVRTVGKVGGEARERCTVSANGFSALYDVELWRQEDGSVGVMLIDMTGQVRDSASIHALSLELAHRTKNVLAVVLSLATQTGRRMPDYTSFKDRFFDQVAALSSAHDMIAASGWEGVTVADIMAACIESEDGANGTALSIDPEAGDAVLKPNAVQNLSIILRELQTTRSGDTATTCDIAAAGDGAIDMTWTCKGGGDGGDLWTDMLCTHAPTSLEGSGTLDRDDTGYRYRLRIGGGQRV